MPDVLAPNALFDPRQALAIQQPDPGNVSLADAWSANTQMLGAEIARQRAISEQQGLWGPGGMTPAGARDAAQQYGNAIMLGTTAPGPAKITPMDAFLDAVDEAHSKAGLDKMSHINLFPHTPGEAEISHIGVDEAHRGKGIGNQIMGIVTDAADKHGITLHASPASDADASTGLDYAGLRDWYDRWGFDQPGAGDRLTRSPFDPEQQ